MCVMGLCGEYGVAPVIDFAGGKVFLFMIRAAQGNAAILAVNSNIMFPVIHSERSGALIPIHGHGTDKVWDGLLSERSGRVRPSSLAVTNA